MTIRRDMDMGLKVDWKPIKDAQRTGLIYWLSGWMNGKLGTKRWVCSGWYSENERGWVDEDDELIHPTHFAEKYLPDPPTN